MKLRARVDVLTTTLLAALGALPLGCGGSAVADRGQSGSGGSATGAGGVNAGGTAPNPHPCESPIATEDGYEHCADGTRRRVSAVACSSQVPRPDPVPNYDPAVDLCQYDSDCTAGPLGYCTDAGPTIGNAGPHRACTYGCITDADCATGTICVCGGATGVCQTANCATGADCAPGFDCRSYDRRDICWMVGFACQTPEDGCATDADCVGSPDGAKCTHLGTTAFCADLICEVGRPFLVRGEARVAAGQNRRDWLDGAVEPVVDALPWSLRRRLAEEWRRAGLMEHASIAAFARFTLQLLSLGAPADLVEAASRALADETSHAEACFALASRYQGHAVGPGPLPIDGSLEQATLTDVVILTVREGCIGETVAALQAAEAAEHAAEPAVRALLLRIAADETRHAELAWRFVRWAIETSGDGLRRSVAAEFERSAQESPDLAAAVGSERDLLEHGVLPEGVRRAISAQALTQVVGPCARALCASVGPFQRQIPAVPALRLT